MTAGIAAAPLTLKNPDITLHKIYHSSGDQSDQNNSFYHKSLLHKREYRAIIDPAS
jgi:hypothetical protein